MDHNLKTMNCKTGRSTKQKKQRKIHKIADRNYRRNRDKDFQSQNCGPKSRNCRP
jgi:hypothetical protein